MITSPDDIDPATSTCPPPQPTPRSSIPAPVDPHQHHSSRDFPISRLDSVMGLENFRFCSVLGRGHFGKVSDAIKLINLPLAFS